MAIRRGVYKAMEGNFRRLYILRRSYRTCRQHTPTGELKCPTRPRRRPPLLPPRRRRLTSKSLVTVPSSRRSLLFPSRSGPLTRTSGFRRRVRRTSSRPRPSPRRESTSPLPRRLPPSCASITRVSSSPWSSTARRSRAPIRRRKTKTDTLNSLSNLGHDKLALLESPPSSPSLGSKGSANS